MRPHRFPLVIALAAGLFALLWVRAPAEPEVDRDAMIGTWTDEAGPPGNSIRLYFIPHDIPGAPYAVAFEGHVTLVNFLGCSNARGSWGYGSSDPLILNM